MEPIRLRVLRVCERTIVTARGDIDLSTASLFESCLLDEVTRGERNLVVNLSHTNYLDSSGLAVLLRIHKKLQDAHGRLSVVGCRPCVLRVFQIVGFQYLFPIEAFRSRRALAAVA